VKVNSCPAGQGMARE